MAREVPCRTTGGRHQWQRLIGFDNKDRYCLEWGETALSGQIGLEDEGDSTKADTEWIIIIIIIRKVSVTPVVVGALGPRSTRFQEFTKDIGITIKTAHAQKTALLGTARVSRLVPSSRALLVKEKVMWSPWWTDQSIQDLALRCWFSKHNNYENNNDWKTVKLDDDNDYITTFSVII